MYPIFRWGVPSDAAAWSALGLAAITWLTWRSWKAPVLEHRRATLIGLALGAGALSVAYVHYYLKGGPRIIDATSYYLEAKALAQGLFSFEPLTPSGSFRGRFLTGPASTSELSVIFPPGYPLLLALGFVIGQPLLIGPLLAVLLVLLTYHLAWRMFDCPKLALGAAALSASSGALRYHTADTMSHAWAALLFAGCLALLTYPRQLAAAAAGLLAGWLLATRPVTGVLCVLLSLGWLKTGWRTLAFAAALAPGSLLLLWHQYTATGEWLTSSQLHYYALADGPPGCFKYGFGEAVGCVHEHGDVRRALAGGFGFVQALTTSVYRLHWHTLDVANFEPLWLLVPYAVFIGRRERRVRLLGLAALGSVLAYAPFYFNGSYPGAGARFLADTLPLEHVLLAFALTKLGAFRAALSLSLLGFALHASFSHQALAERDGGAPMFSASALAKRGIERGLVLVNTDHGFNLGFDPAARDAQRGLVVARDRGDAHDRVLWETLGRPAVYRYRFSPWASNPGPLIVERTDLGSERNLTFEAEAEWPPLWVAGGYSYPTHVGPSCASGGRALKLVPVKGNALSVELELVSLVPGPHRIEVGWVKATGPSHAFRFELAWGRAREPHQKWTGATRFERAHCQTEALGEATLQRGAHRVLLTVQREAYLDFVRLVPPEP